MDDECFEAMCVYSKTLAVQCFWFRSFCGASLLLIGILTLCLVLCEGWYSIATILSLGLHDSILDGCECCLTPLAVH